MLPLPIHNTLIVSDVHLGSHVCRANALLATLDAETYDHLILLGDIFDDLHLRRLKQSHWHVLSRLRQLSDHVQVVWVEGNHDWGLSEITSHFLGAPVYQTYTWTQAGLTMLALHGHQFDHFLVDHPWISDLATWGYHGLQHRCRQRWLARRLKRLSKRWLRLSQQVADPALMYAGTRHAAYVFCGHTHVAMMKTVGTATYWNTGCWTDVPSSYIAVKGDHVELCEVF
jgi:UDP-2,3-diacylglucosamine pyrophosphatase LpxH